MENSEPAHSSNISDTKLPIAYPSGKKKLPDTGVVLAADVGGTKTNLALFEIQQGNLVSIKRQHYPTSDHDSFVKAIRSFYSDDSPAIDCACLGVAGNVDENKVQGVNFAWEIDADKLESELNVNRILLINDLEANAYGLSALEEDDFEIIAKGGEGKGNAAIISPGTGLGEAGLFWDALQYHPFATEGGHCNFSPKDALDVELWKFLNAKFGRVSWERMVSGKGIYNIYQFLRQYRGVPEPEWLTRQIQSEDPPIAVSNAAIEKKDPVCVETLQLFMKYLSMESAQLALKTKAKSGIFIGGGIVPKILSLIDKDEFYHHFTDVGRMKGLLETIPVKIVLNERTALIGAAYYAAMSIFDYSDRIA